MFCITNIFYDFSFAAFIIYFHICGVMYFQENTLISAPSPHKHFLLNDFVFMGSNSSNKTSLLPQQKMQEKLI